MDKNQLELTFFNKSKIFQECVKEQLFIYLKKQLLQCNNQYDSLINSLESSGLNEGVLPNAIRSSLLIPPHDDAELNSYVGNSVDSVNDDNDDDEEEEEDMQNDNSQVDDDDDENSSDSADENLDDDEDNDKEIENDDDNDDKEDDDDDDNDGDEQSDADLDEEFMNKFMMEDIQLPKNMLAKVEQSKSVKKSKFDKYQDEYNDEIKAIEDEYVQEFGESNKPWKMKGEVTANARPLDSIVQENLDVDKGFITRPSNAFDVELNLVRIMQNAVKEQAYDDVEPKSSTNLKPTQAPFKDIDISQQPKSLSEVYEAEHMRRTQLLNSTQENATHETLRKDLLQLFAKLDALSHNACVSNVSNDSGKTLFQPAVTKFTGKIKDQRLVAMPEQQGVATIAMDLGGQIAEENAGIKGGRKRQGCLVSKLEMSKEERRRVRRCKKLIHGKVVGGKKEKIYKEEGGGKLKEKSEAMQAVIRLANKPNSRIRIMDSVERKRKR